MMDEVAAMRQEDYSKDKDWVMHNGKSDGDQWRIQNFIMGADEKK